MNKKKISATEINKFTYCPYQWYYEQTYGKTELLRLARMNYDGKNRTESAFERGKKFHDRYHSGYLIKKRIVRAIIFLLSAAVFAAACYCIYIIYLRA